MHGGGGRGGALAPAPRRLCCQRAVLCGSTHAGNPVCSFVAEHGLEIE